VQLEGRLSARTRRAGASLVRQFRKFEDLEHVTTMKRVRVEIARLADVLRTTAPEPEDEPTETEAESPTEAVATEPPIPGLDLLPPDKADPEYWDRRFGGYHTRRSLLALSLIGSGYINGRSYSRAELLQYCGSVKEFIRTPDGEVTVVHIPSTRDWALDDSGNPL